MIWLIGFIALIALAAYFRVSLMLITLNLAVYIFAFQQYSAASAATLSIIWIVFAIIFIPLNIYPLRRNIFSRPVYKLMSKIMPQISSTEQEALDAGDVWWEADLFSGKPNFNRIHKLPKPTLSEKEQAFLDGPVEELCGMLNDWKITHDDSDLSPEIWQFIKDKGFFSMIIPEEYGGLEFSAYCHSQVIIKLGSRSGSAAVTVMVPNSLGPGKLLLTYGTEEQKNHYLPRLAKGEDIPCFALTGPSAGSDAGAMPDTGVVCYGSFEGKENVLGIRLNWEKRYITLAPVATLLGLAFKLKDPEHLLSDVTDRGITLALIKTETEGIEIGKRHFPLDQAFMNGPVRGKDVFIPIDWIIGGTDYVGKGWSMLMECLSDGRAISLPALGTAGGKMTSKFTGAYARIRKQFHAPIGYFEGIEEPLAEIGGQAYAMESARLLVLACLDNGDVPSVVSGIVKQQLMQRLRTTINHAMDIHGGHGICMGPNNYIARYYQLVPVGITVEGANILTRSLMIFGQGAMRSHPYLLKEVAAVHSEDKKQGLINFDIALFAHAGFIISNVVRTFWIGLTASHLLLTPGKGITKYYYRQLVRSSSAFALMTDVCVTLLGGSLKRREKISGRLADALSNMYVLTSVLKHYEDDGSPKEDIPLLKWACDDALFNIQQAMKGIMTNLPVPVIGSILNLLIFPLSKPYQKPDDKLGHQVARLLLEPSATLDRLTSDIHINKNPDDAIGRILAAQDLVIETVDLERKLRAAKRKGELQSDDANLYEEAMKKSLIDKNEFELLEKTRLAVQNAIKVDEFSNSGWKVETP